MIDINWAPIAGAIVGFAVGLTGIGGGALMAPILLEIFNIDLKTVVATDLLFATFTKIFVGGIHVRNKFADWTVVRRLWIGSLTTTIIVVVIINSGWSFHSSLCIKRFLGVLIFISGLSVMFKDYLDNIYIKGKNNYLSQESKKIFSVVAGGVLGGLVTLTSVGAGALGVVFIRSLYPEMKIKTLVATDVIHAIPVSFLGGISLLLIGMTHIKLLALLLIGSIPAAILGGWMVGKIPPAYLKWVLTIVLLFAGSKLILV